VVVTRESKGERDKAKGQRGKATPVHPREWWGNAIMDIARSRGPLSRSESEILIHCRDAAIPQHRGRHSREGGNPLAQ